jgi:hypothetical protein
MSRERRRMRSRAEGDTAQVCYVGAVNTSTSSASSHLIRGFSETHPTHPRLMTL